MKLSQEWLVLYGAAFSQIRTIDFFEGQSTGVNDYGAKAIATVPLDSAGLFSGENAYVYSIQVADNGTRLFLNENDSTGMIYEFTMSTPYDITTATPTGKTWDGGSAWDNTQYLIFDEGAGGILLNWNGEIKRFTMSMPYDITTATLEMDVLDLYGLSFFTGMSYNIWVTPGLDAVYFVENSKNANEPPVIYKVPLNTPGDLGGGLNETAATMAIITATVNTATNGALAISNDGKLMVASVYRPGEVEILIHELETPWEVQKPNGESGLKYLGSVMQTGGSTNYHNGLWVEADGKFYSTNYMGDVIQFQIEPVDSVASYGYKFEVDQINQTIIAEHPLKLNFDKQKAAFVWEGDIRVAVPGGKSLTHFKAMTPGGAIEGTISGVGGGGDLEIQVVDTQEGADIVINKIEIDTNAIEGETA